MHSRKLLPALSSAAAADVGCEAADDTVHDFSEGRATSAADEMGAECGRHRERERGSRRIGLA